MEEKQDKQDKIKEKLMEYGMDLGKNIVFSVLKWAVLPKKKDKGLPVSSTQALTVVQPKKSKSFKLIKNAAIFFLAKELVYERIKAKIIIKPDTKDYSWVMDYPIKVVDLNDYIKLLGKDSKVLDLGSGSGYFAIEVAKKIKPNGKVFCVDLNIDALKNSQASAVKNGVANIEFHRANIQRLPFESGSMDHAFINMTIGQVADKVKTLSEVYRVLKKGGYLYITELLLDKNYSIDSTLVSLVSSIGFRPISERGNFIMYTLAFRKD